MDFVFTADPHIVVALADTLLFLACAALACVTAR